MDLKELNKTISSMPSSKKNLIAFLVLCLVCVLGYYYVYTPRQKKIGIMEPELEKLQNQLKENLEITKGIKDIEKELEKIKIHLIEAQAQLPTEKEIPSLLTKISDLGTAAGLEFILFQPKAEVPQEFYNEVPIDIVIKGSYHNVALFYDMIAHLPRIVNIGNISLRNPNLREGTVVLEISCLATTFRFTATTPEGGGSK